MILGDACRSCIHIGEWASWAVTEPFAVAQMPVRQLACLGRGQMLAPAGGGQGPGARA